ncbi:hypothetical protein ACWDV7_09890 [Streptomyces sp. NPDC003362]
MPRRHRIGVRAARCYPAGIRTARRHPAGIRTAHRHPAGARPVRRPTGTPLVRRRLPEVPPGVLVARRLVKAAVERKTAK